MDIQSRILGMSGAARETLRCLFFHGPTWDGDVPSKAGRDELCDLKLAERGFGWQWLTREGVDFSVTVMMYDREKEKWQRKRADLT
jgi:hypothetical protein